MAEDPKSFLKQVAPPSHFSVDSKWEDWMVDGMGNILSHGEAKSAGRPQWFDVKKFDVEGYKRRTGHYPTGTISIYDISYWRHNGDKITSFYEMSFGQERSRLARRARRDRLDAKQARRHGWQEAEDPKGFFKSRPLCKCGCRLFNGWCSDDTCPHSNWTQDVDVNDLYSLTADALARKYPQGKRKWVGEAEDPKKLFREMPRRHDIAAFSGDWVTDREGNVLAFTPDYNTHDEQEAKDIAHYESIVKFDFNEYRAYWGDLPSGMDISDVAYWTADGTYHKADEQYRQDTKTGGIER